MKIIDADVLLQIARDNEETDNQKFRYVKELVDMTPEINVETLNNTED